MAAKKTAKRGKKPRRKLMTLAQQAAARELVRRLLSTVVLVAAILGCSGRIQTGVADGAAPTDASDGSTGTDSRADGTTSVPEGGPDVVEADSASDGSQDGPGQADGCSGDAEVVIDPVCYEESGEWYCPCEYDAPACPSGVIPDEACGWDGGCYYCDEGAGIYCACEGAMSDGGATWTCVGAGNGC